MAKRARSIRSTSNDSKSGNADAHGTNLTENGDHSHGGIVQVEEIDSKDLALSTINVDSVQHLKPPVDIHHAPAKATSAELEDLLAEGRAAASMTGITGNNISNVVEQHERHVDRKQHHRRDVSEVGEIRDDTSHREQELRAPQQSPLKTDRFTASEIDEIDMWLAMTGYYDKAYRDKVLNRRKRLQAIEEERLKLLEEEQEDHRLRGQYHNNTPFCTPQRPTPVVATIQPTPIAKEDLGLRIKNSAPKTRTTPEKTMSSDDLPVKRRIEEEPSDTEAPHQPKIARSEIHRRSPARSKHGSPERHQNRSLSPGKARKQRAGPVSRRQSVHSAEGYDRWVPDNDRDRRGPMDRSLEEHGRRNDNRGRYDQRRDSGLSISHLAKPDFRTGRTRFFLLKSWNYENIATAQREGTWATQVKNEDTFVEAFKTCRHVIFFFSANHSKAFQGYARMQGLPGERGVSQPSWVKNLHWPTTAPFRIRWIVKDETPYRAVGNLKNPLNENLAVFVGRDGQEIPENLGIQLSDIIDEDTAYRADSRR